MPLWLHRRLLMGGVAWTVPRVGKRCCLGSVRRPVTTQGDQCDGSEAVTEERGKYHLEREVISGAFSWGTGQCAGYFMKVATSVSP